MWICICDEGYVSVNNPIALGSEIGEGVEKFDAEAPMSKEVVKFENLCSYQASKARLRPSIAT